MDNLKCHDREGIPDVINLVCMRDHKGHYFSVQVNERDKICYKLNTAEG